MPSQSDGFHKWWALFGICLLAFTAFLDATIVNTALPFIRTALNASIIQLQWIANIFTIVLSMSLIALGKFADLWGRKKVFYFGVLLFAIAAFGAGWSPNPPSMVFFRGLQSLGASTILVASTSLLSDVFSEKERVHAISIYAGVTGFGLMIGPFLGGIIIELLGWRWVFWINLPIIFVGLAACLFSLKTKTAAPHSVKIDWFGLAFLIFGLGFFLYGLIEGAEKNWGSIAAWIFLGVGALMLFMLILIDLKRENSLLDLHVFKEKLIVLAALSCAFAGVASNVFMFFDPLYLRILRGFSPFLIGFMVAIIPAAQVLISFMFKRSEKKFGVANLLYFSVCAAFIAALLHRFLQADTSLLFLALPFFLLGINWGISNAAMIAAVNQIISPRKIGAALGTVMTIWNFSGSVILAASTAVFHFIETRSSFLPAFHGAIDFNIGFAALVLICATWVRANLSK